MKTIKIIMSLLVAVMFTSSLGAQDQSMLYAITGNGLTETSYLFGTIHLQCEADFIIKDKVKNALDACEQIYFEVDLTDPEIPVKVGAAMMNGPKLSEVLTEEESKKLDVVLQERLGYNVQIVDNFSIGMIAGLLSFTEIKCEDQKSYEMVLLEMAQLKEMPVSGIESLEFQIETLDKGWTKESALTHIHDPKYYSLVGVMLDAYIAEDLPALGDATADEHFMTASEIEWGIEKRNRNWVRLMPEIMEKQATFFAYGAGHLVYDIGVIQLLEKAGYTVTPVFE